MQNADSLLNLSPVDGRYASVTQVLRPYFSEFALMKYRVTVEIRYLAQLSKWNIVRALKSQEKAVLEKIIADFSLEDAKRVKIFEAETKHDVKALEYFLKEKLEKTTLADLLPFVHFGLTSYDTNDLAYGLMLTAAHNAIILPELRTFLKNMKTMITANIDSVMLGKTHGQAAVPTVFGKEVAVFFVRVKQYEKKLSTFRFEGKLNGAVGNYNALEFTFPRVDWIRFSREFIISLGLTPNLVTTQILPCDNLIEYTGMIGHVNTILIGFCQDMWIYISSGLIKQKKEKGQIGSSTMPQKINPIDFENAEGNLQVANSYFELYGRKLLISRMQRDLTDSTVKRTIGTALGHTLLAWKSLERGLNKSVFSKEVGTNELFEHWEVLAEAMQVYMKVYGDEKGYEKVKDLMMGKRIDEKVFRKMTHAFPALLKLTPASYIGLAIKLTTLALKKK
ncbi:MAG: adenylosuccinate lyase [Candidatus Gottesmanbacteria bacterium]|nr:adenylosuccinate lyase [Candidatus Gottesmanbacteria bacterium]